MTNHAKPRSNHLGHYVATRLETLPQMFKRIDLKLQILHPRKEGMCVNGDGILAFVLGHKDGAIDRWEKGLIRDFQNDAPPHIPHDVLIPEVLPHAAVFSSALMVTEYMKYPFVVYELAVREASAEWACVRPWNTRPAVGKIVTEVVKRSAKGVMWAQHSALLDVHLGGVTQTLNLTP